MAEILKNIEGIGEVCFVNSKKARYIRISMRPFKPIRVTVPYRAKIKEAEAFVRQKKTWILKQQVKMLKQEAQKTIFTDESGFETKSHRLSIQSSDLADKIRLTISDGLIKVIHPTDIKVEDEKVQEIARYGIEEALRFEAKLFLPKRTQILAEKHGLSYKKIFIKNTKTRWGSCSAVNNINLSLHLMRLPEELIDYVILHELAHTIEKNHGPNFWKLLDKISGDAKGLDNQLKDYGLKLY